MTQSEDQKLLEIPSHADDVRASVIDGELLLYHPEHTMAVYMNAPASVIWGLCDGHRNVGDIVTLIEESYPVPRSDIIQDVLRTIASLYEKKLLVQRFMH